MRPLAKMHISLWGPGQCSEEQKRHLNNLFAETPEMVEWAFLVDAVIFGTGVGIRVSWGTA